MKTLLLFALIIITSGPVFAQDNLAWKKVVVVDSVSKFELFNRAVAWFSTDFKSGKDVLQLADKEGGKIIGKGSIVYDAPAFSVGTNYSGYIIFTLAVDCKDGKYRYEISAVSHEANMVGYSVNIDGRGHRSKKIREVATMKINSVAKSFEAAMQKTYSSDNW